MAENKNTSKRVASEVSKIRSKTASAMAKSVARSALKQIFDEEGKQRESERQHTLPGQQQRLILIPHDSVRERLA